MSALLRLWLVCVALSATCADALNLKLKGVNYDFRQGPDYDPNRCKASALIARELRLLSAVTPRVRVYSVSDCNVRPVFRYAKQYNLTVWLGVWVSNDTKVFDKELKTLTAMADEGVFERGLLAGVNVGSEALYRNDSTPTQLINNMKRVKEVLAAHSLGNVPVSITDTLGELLKNPSVIEAVDVVTFNLFPFWSKIDIKDAAQNLNKSIASFQGSVGGSNKPFVITETGWASNGADSRASEANPKNAAQYLNDFFVLADAQNWSYYYFSGFDTPYRKEVEKNTDTVEAYFGLFSSTGRMNKHYETLSINGTRGHDGSVTETPVPTSAPTPAKTNGAARSSFALSSGTILALGILWMG
ncbi:hypothetical protein PybrP1_007239 [[Pythium] brassicae (nom. inval.)]|nr:hypothetical protein PybrP1_007239 [[Pythium] brassicae (nom. inval.)]